MSLHGWILNKCTVSGCGDQEGGSPPEPPDSRPAASRSSAATRSARLDGATLTGYVRIEPGTFVMGDIEGYVEDASPPFEVTLTRAFAMQQTEVTQKQWIEVLGEDPSYHHRTDSPYLPVENLSFYSALAFCNALSDLEGYEPCYDLSDCWGSAAWGQLDCGGVPDISLDCEGYRLPTEAEWEYAARAGSANRKAWFEEPGGTLVDLDKFEWMLGQYGPMPVGFSPPNPLGALQHARERGRTCVGWRLDVPGSAPGRLD